MSQAPRRWVDDKYGPQMVVPRVRMRLTEETGVLLHDILLTFHKVESEAREQARIDGVRPLTTYNRTLRKTWKLLEECERALEEAGWLTDSASSSER